MTVVRTLPPGGPKVVARACARSPVNLISSARLTSDKQSRKRERERQFRRKPRFSARKVCLRHGASSLVACRIRTSDETAAIWISRPARPTTHKHTETSYLEQLHHSGVRQPDLVVEFHFYCRHFSVAHRRLDCVCVCVLLPAKKRQLFS